MLVLQRSVGYHGVASIPEVNTTPATAPERAHDPPR